MMPDDDYPHPLGLLGAAPCSASRARQLLASRVCPWEVLGDVSWDGREWSAAINLPPGPLFLVGFKISKWEMPNAKP
jgi:hypothetical protein